MRFITVTLKVNTLIFLTRNKCFRNLKQVKEYFSTAGHSDKTNWGNITFES